MNFFFTLTRSMKRTAFWIQLLGIPFIAGCAGVGTGPPSTDETRATIVAFFEAFNAHDLDGVLAFYDPDVVTQTPADLEPRRGLQVTREIYSGIFDGLPEVHDTVHRIIAHGDEAAVEFTARWVVAPEGGKTRHGEMRIAAFLKLRDGRFIEHTTYYDPRPLMQADAP